MRSHVTEIEKNSYCFTLVHPCGQTVPEPREVGFGGQLRMDSRSLSFRLVLFPIRWVKKRMNLPWVYPEIVKKNNQEKNNYIKNPPASSIHQFSSLSSHKVISASQPHSFHPFWHLLRLWINDFTAFLHHVSIRKQETWGGSLAANGGRKTGFYWLVFKWAI